MQICLKVRQVFFLLFGLLLLLGPVGALGVSCKTVLRNPSKAHERRSYLEVRDLRDLFVGEVQERRYRELPPEEGIQKARELAEYQRLIESLYEHLSLIGLDFAYGGKAFLVRPSSVTPLNRASRSLHREGLRSVEHDVAKAVINRAVGSYSAQRQVMTVSFQALITARPDANFVHESVHANMSRADKMDFFRPLLGRFRRHEPEKPGESGYEKYLNFQEIMTFARDLRILVGEAERQGLKKEIQKKINQKVRKLLRFLEQAQAVENLVSRVARQVSAATKFERIESAEREIIRISNSHDLVLFPEKVSNLEGVRVLVRGPAFEYDVFFRKSEIEEIRRFNSKKWVQTLMRRISDGAEDLGRIRTALRQSLEGLSEVSPDNASKTLPRIRRLRNDIYEVLEQRIDRVESVQSL